MGKYSYLAKNTFLFTISSFGSKILSIFLVPLYTNILSTSDYGIADLLQVSAGLFSFVFPLNIAAAVMRFAIEDVANSEKYLKQGVKVILYSGIVFSLCVLACFLADAFPWPNYFYLFLILLFFFEAFESLLSQYLKAIDKVHVMVVGGLLSTFSRLTLAVLALVVLKWGLVGYVTAITIAPIISVAYLAYYSVKEYYRKEEASKSQSNAPQSNVPKTNEWQVQQLRQATQALQANERQDRQEPQVAQANGRILGEMLKYSIPATINSLGWWIASGIDRYFIAWMKGASLNGIYAVSYKISTVFSTIFGIFIQAWGLSAIKEFDPEDKNHFFSNLYAVFNCLVVLLASMLICANITISRILFAKDFFEAWKYSSILILTMVFNGLSGYLGGIFFAVKDSNTLAVSTFVSALVNIVFNIVLIPQYGATGAAIGTAASFFSVWQIRLYTSRKYIRLRIKLLRDYMAYILLALQIIFEHKFFENKLFVLGQGAVFAVIIMMYREEIKMLWNKCCGIFREKRLLWKK